MIYFIIYLIIINIVAVAITIHDKLAAIHKARRVPEATLMIIAALGGAPGMYVTMLIIRHKTRKPLFMIGIPVIFIAEIVLLIVLNNALHIF